MTAKFLAFAALLLAGASSAPALAAGPSTVAAGNGHALEVASSSWHCYRYIKLPGRRVVGYKKWCPAQLPAIRP